MIPDDSPAADFAAIDHHLARLSRHVQELAALIPMAPELDEALAIASLKRGSRRWAR